MGRRFPAISLALQYVRSEEAALAFANSCARAVGTTMAAAVWCIQTRSLEGIPTKIVQSAAHRAWHMMAAENVRDDRLLSDSMPGKKPLLWKQRWRRRSFGRERARSYSRLLLQKSRGITKKPLVFPVRSGSGKSLLPGQSWRIHIVCCMVFVNIVPCPHSDGASQFEL
jgi:hypothetical protein